MSRCPLGFVARLMAILILTKFSITDTSLVQHFSKFNIQNISLEQYLSECILDIVEAYFNTDFRLIVQTPGTWVTASPHLQDSNGNGDILLKMLSMDYLFPYVTLGYREFNTIPLNKGVKPSFHLMLVSAKTLTSTIHTIQQMIYRVKYNIRNDEAQTIIAVIDPIKTFEEQIPLARHILQIAWQLSHLTNVIVITTVQVQPNLYYFDIFGWTPEQNDICEMKINNIISLGRYSSNHDKIILANLFPTKKLRDLKGCMLDIAVNSMFPYIFIADREAQGIYMNFLRTAAKNMNFKMSLRGYQHHRTSDMTIPVLASNYKDCTYLYPYIKQETAWHVPSGQHIPLWQCVFKVFNVTTWILIGITFISGTLTFWFLGILSNFKHVHVETKLTVILLHLLLTHLGMGVPDRYHGPAAIMFFLLWLGYSLQIYTLYQSSFTGHLVNPPKLPHIKRERELMQSNLQLLSMIDMKHLENYNQFPFCQNETLECFKRLADNKDIALISDRTLADLFLRGFFSKSGKPEFVALEENLESVYYSIYVQRLGCMLWKRLNSLQERLFQAGIFNIYLDELHHAFSMYQNKHLDIQTVISFKISHLQGPFFLLIIGLSLGLTVFCVELFFYYKLQ